MLKNRSVLLVFITVLLVYVSIRSTYPSAPRSGAISDSAFSVKRAFNYLKEISKTPHATGSADNARVRSYIIAACKQYGFDVQIQHAMPISERHQTIRVGNIYNIIASKKGTQNTKAVVLMAHYDSEPTTQGAGDDGAAVAAILETARGLQHAAPLKNDLVLLFTDGEEIGLLGAQAFVKENPLVKEIGLVINFEGRGNSGPSNMFEVNDKNGWVVSEYAKAAPYPFANSLGYEVYKKLPNITDFTHFKNAGITG